MALRYRKYRERTVITEFFQSRAEFLLRMTGLEFGWRRTVADDLVVDGRS